MAHETYATSGAASAATLAPTAWRSSTAGIVVTADVHKGGAEWRTGRRVANADSGVAGRRRRARGALGRPFRDRRTDRREETQLLSPPAACGAPELRKQAELAAHDTVEGSARHQPWQGRREKTALYGGVTSLGPLGRKSRGDHLAHLLGLQPSTTILDHPRREAAERLLLDRTREMIERRRSRLVPDRRLHRAGAHHDHVDPHQL